MTKFRNVKLELQAPVLCHCKTPAKTNDIVHISAEFLKMKVFPLLLTALIVESIFTCEMLCLHSCP